MLSVFRPAQFPILFPIFSSVFFLLLVTVSICLTNPVIMSLFTGGMADESWKSVFLQPLQELSPPYPQLWGIARLALKQGTLEAVILIRELFLAFKFLSMEVSSLIWLLKQNNIDLSSPSVTKEWQRRNKVEWDNWCSHMSTDFIWMNEAGLVGRHRQQETTPAPVHTVRASAAVWEETRHSSYIRRQWGNNVHVAQIAGV